MSGANPIAMDRSGASVSDPTLKSLRNDPHYQIFINKVSYPDPEVYHSLPALME